MARTYVTSCPSPHSGVLYLTDSMVPLANGEYHLTGSLASGAAVVLTVADVFDRSLRRTLLRGLVNVRLSVTCSVIEEIFHPPE